jgi:hypothetical protein
VSAAPGFDKLVSPERAQYIKTGGAALGLKKKKIQKIPKYKTSLKKQLLKTTKP